MEYASFIEYARIGLFGLVIGAFVMFPMAIAGSVRLLEFLEFRRSKIKKM